jgi:hypothetical protein
LRDKERSRSADRKLKMHVDSADWQIIDSKKKQVVDLPAREEKTEVAAKSGSVRQSAVAAPTIAGKAKPLARCDEAKKEEKEKEEEEASVYGGLFDDDASASASEAEAEEDWGGDGLFDGLFGGAPATGSIASRDAPAPAPEPPAPAPRASAPPPPAPAPAPRASAPPPPVAAKDSSVRMSNRASSMAAGHGFERAAAVVDGGGHRGFERGAAVACGRSSCRCGCYCAARSARAETNCSDAAAGTGASVREEHNAGG